MANYPKNVYHPVHGFARAVESKEQEEAWTAQGWLPSAPKGVEPPAPVAPGGDAEPAEKPKK